MDLQNINFQIKMQDMNTKSTLKNYKHYKNKNYINMNTNIETSICQTTKINFNTYSKNTKT